MWYMDASIPNCGILYGEVKKPLPENQHLYTIGLHLVLVMRNLLAILNYVLLSSDKIILPRHFLLFYSYHVILLMSYFYRVTSFSSVTSSPT
jgi:hypothetical protein